MCVATYAFDKASSSKNVKPLDAFAVGMAHDLLEDTGCTPEQLSKIMEPELVGAVFELTKDDDESYDDYDDED